MAKIQRGEKAAKEAADRARHLQSLKEAKALRRNEPKLIRYQAIKEDLPKILILCEGKNTEPSYFEQFKLASAKIVVLGKGNNTISLVKQAQQLNEKHDYAQVWCVFDRDDFPALDFNNAIAMADGSGFGVAYSNQSFEYWLILHFDDHQGGGMARTDYHDKLNDLLSPFGAEYAGKDSKVVQYAFSEFAFDISTM